MALIVYIDSDNRTREAFAQRLESAGHKVLQAVTGPFGLELCHEFTPDLVITTPEPIDAEMEEPDYLTNLARCAPDTPVIVLMEDDGTRGGELSTPPEYCVLLVKPLSFTDLSYAIRAAGRRARLTAETS